MRAVGNPQGHGSVAEVVDSQGCEPRSSNGGLPEPSSEEGRSDGMTVRRSEHEVVWLRAGSCEICQCLAHERGHRHRPDARLRLRWTEVDLCLDVDKCLGHTYALTFEIHPSPPKTEELPEAEATEAGASTNAR